MAWVKVKEQGHLAGSKKSRSGRTATRVFVAISDTPVTPRDAETASHGGTTIPLLGELLPGVGETRRADDIDVKPDPESARRVFTVTVDYTNKGVSKPEDPLDHDPEITWDFNDYTETYFEDRTPEDEDGPKRVLNTAYQMFEEFLERDSGSIKCTITKNIAADAYDPAVAVAYKDTLNEDAFDVDGVTIGIGQCKMKSYTVGPRQTENGVVYRAAQWVLEFKEIWDVDVESRGYEELGDGTPPPWVEITNNKGKRVDSPWPLDENGEALDDPAGDPHVITFKPYFYDTFAGWETLWEYAA